MSNGIFEQHKIHVYQLWLKIIIFEFVFTTLLELTKIIHLFVRELFGALIHEAANNWTIVFIINISHDGCPVGVLKTVLHFGAEDLDESSHIICSILKEAISKNTHALMCSKT